MAKPVAEALSAAEVDALGRVVVDWQLRGQMVVPLREPWRFVESLIHEVAHAAVFRMRAGPGCVNRTVIRFRSVEAHNGAALGLVYEAQTLAVESLVVADLGLRAHIPMYRLIRAAWDVNRSEGMPWWTFRELVTVFRNSRDSARIGNRVVRDLRRLAREHLMGASA